MICAIAGPWWPPTRQPRGVIPIRRNYSRIVGILELKFVYIPNVLPFFSLLGKCVLFIAENALLP
jgi:hypothetical protein